MSKQNTSTDHIGAKNKYQEQRKVVIQVSVLDALAGQLAYELIPTTDEHIMRIDSLINSAT